MAYGLHWEWRGFGTLTTDVRAQIEKLEAEFDAPERVTDEYLWIPGSRINVKFRSKGNGSLKFKRVRVTDSETGLELWEEKPEEEYAFPISSKAQGELAAALRLDLHVTAEPMDRTSLLTALRASRAGVKVVSIQKLRRARKMHVTGGKLTVEIAEIDSPERITTVGIEDDFLLNNDSTAEEIGRAKLAVAGAVGQLRLGTALRRMNYVEATEQWAGRAGT
jgi:hypothetical protein